MAGVEVNIEPFQFPNFLKVREWKDHTFPVGALTMEQASAYWDELKPLWLAHVRKKRLHLEDAAREAAQSSVGKQGGE